MASVGAHVLGASDVGISFPNRNVFESVSLGMNEGDRIGIVGRNGDGKSTLLGLLAGSIEPHRGRITHRGGLRIGMLAQSDALDNEMTIGSAIVGTADDHEWAGQARIREIINGLVPDLPWMGKVGELSGGQRRRVDLARLLVGEWDVLLLDEPTNHLDLEGITWLAHHLKNRWPRGQGVLAAVTHDRWFLDEVSLTTWEVHDGLVEPFDGGYAAYILQRVERDRQAAVIETKRRNLMRKELAWLRRGAPARTSKPKFRLDAASELIGNEPPPRDAVELERLASTRLGKDVVDFADVNFTYPGHEVLHGITWSIGPGERIGILGMNGAGKSTLLKLIDGTLRATTGRVKQGKTVSIATLTQRAEELDELAAERVIDVLSELKATYSVGVKRGPAWAGRAGDQGGQEMTPSALLERLGFGSAHLATPVGDLSGGQKRRLQLTLVLLKEPNVLILDEPSNDLDTDMLVAMEDLLDTWPGTLIVVSHDRYLLERVTDIQYAVIDGHVRHMPGGIDGYLRYSQNSQPQPGQISPATTNSGEKTDSQSTAPTNIGGAELRSTKKEITALERKLAKLHDELSTLNKTLSAHDPSDYEGLIAISGDVERTQSDIDELEERWHELGELIENPVTR